MEVKVNTKQLKEIIKNCSFGNTLPILTNFLLKAEDGKLTVYGTDLEVYTTFTIPAVVKKDGVILINHKKLSNIIKTLKDKDKEITIKTENDFIFINNVKIKIDFEPDDFPLPESYPSDLAVSISGKELLKGITKTMYASTKDISRFALDGVCFSFTSDKLDFVATDGHRLALYSTEIDGKGLEGKYVIPTKTIKLLKNVIKPVYDNIEFVFNNKYAFFKVDNTVIQTKLLEGVFPDYKQVIPDKFNLEIKLDRYFFTNLINEFISLIPEKDKPIFLHITNNQLTITYNSDDVFIERVYSLNESYPDFKIKFNAKYIYEAVNVIEDRYFIMKFVNKDSQTVIIPENPEEKYLAVVMPMTME